MRDMALYRNGLTVNTKLAADAGHDTTGGWLPASINAVDRYLTVDTSQYGVRSFLKEIVALCNVKPNEYGFQKASTPLLEGTVMNVDPATPAHLLFRDGSIRLITFYDIIPPQDSMEREQKLKKFNEYMEEMQADKTPIKHERPVYFDGVYAGEPVLGWFQDEIPPEERPDWTPTLGRGGSIMVHLCQTQVESGDTYGGTEYRWVLVLRGTDLDVEHILKKRARELGSTIYGAVADKRYLQAINLIKDNFSVLATHILAAVGLSLDPHHQPVENARPGYSPMQGHNLLTHSFLTVSPDSSSGRPQVYVYRDVYPTGELARKESAMVFVSPLKGYIRLPMMNKQSAAWTLEEYLNGFPASGCVLKENIMDFMAIHSNKALRKTFEIVGYNSPVGWNRRLTHYEKVDNGERFWPLFNYNPHTLSGERPVIRYRSLSLTVTAPHELDTDLDVALHMTSDEADDVNVIIPLTGKIHRAILHRYKHLARNERLLRAHGVEVREGRILELRELELKQHGMNYIEVKRATLIVLKEYLEKKYGAQTDST